MRWGIRIALACALSACALAAHAGGSGSRADVRKTAVSTMLVTGSVDIATDGTVSAHRLDQPEKLPEVVRELVDRVVPQWQFEPVEIDGRVVKARAKMGVRVTATYLDGENYRLRVTNASFGEEAETGGKVVKSGIDLTPPVYPMAAAESNISGSVYLILKIGRGGRVEDVVAEQTNLTVLGNERQMRISRNILEKASIAAARKWTFDTSVLGLADAPFWSVRVPIAFQLYDGSKKSSDDDLKTAYGTWEAYIPGPKNPVPWLDAEQNRQSPDALIAGTAYPVGRGPKLLTPLDQG